MREATTVPDLPAAVTPSDRGLPIEFTQYLLTQKASSCYAGAMTQDLEHRARVHAALGDPVRLAIVEELATSDRSPKELGNRFGLPSNLLAHHLEVLEAVGLIERFVSAGDRRRRYLRLVRSPLAEIRVDAAPLVGRALFVCSHNSARSQLAAALWRARTGNAASSAGTHPAERINPGAIAAAKRAGLDLGGAAPRVLEPGESADLVVTVCDQAHEELDPAPSWWHWSIPDPVEAGTARAFDAVVAELNERMTNLEVAVTA